ncbi:hypothetical protein DFP73DRAFT_405288 [Morchella snyderi]|nr:hypothetical protein DFP73DRAFT_405288 [Morchella snyderi]
MCQFVPPDSYRWLVGCPTFAERAVVERRRLRCMYVTVAFFSLLFSLISRTSKKKGKSVRYINLICPCAPLLLCILSVCLSVLSMLLLASSV